MKVFPWIVTLLACGSVFFIIFMGLTDPQEMFRQSYAGDYTPLLIMIVLLSIASYVLSKGAIKSTKKRI